MQETITSIAVDVLRKEIAGLHKLEGTLKSDEFCRAVQLVLDCKGRVVVTGVGKSGHIGRKIAASLASLGTPSFFVHSTEGVHGDLGMVTADDIVIAISNSGSSREVLDLLPSLSIIKPTLIAITGNRQSELAKSAEVVLLIGSQNEADHLGVAPTTSTVATLALGDALAVTVAKLKGFGKRDFGVFHPGGKLGEMVRRELGIK